MIQVNHSELFQALSELARRYQFRNRDEVCCYGLTVSQCYALQSLHNSSVLTGSELAANLGLDLSSTTRLLDQLVRKRLITRRKRPVDLRVRELELTPFGIRLMERIEADMTKVLADALTEFPPEVQQALPAALRRLTQALQDCSDSELCEDQNPVEQKNLHQANMR